MGKAAGDLGASLDLVVEVYKLVGRSQLSALHRRAGYLGQHIVLGLGQEGGELGSRGCTSRQTAAPGGRRRLPAGRPETRASERRHAVRKVSASDVPSASRRSRSWTTTAMVTDRDAASLLTHPRLGRVQPAIRPSTCPRPVEEAPASWRRFPRPAARPGSGICRACPGPHQPVARAGGPALAMGLLEHRGQRPLLLPPRLTAAGAGVPRPELRSLQLDRAGAGLPDPVAPAVRGVIRSGERSPYAAPAKLSTASSSGRSVKNPSISRNRSASELLPHSDRKVSLSLVVIVALLRLGELTSPTLNRHRDGLRWKPVLLQPRWEWVPPTDPRLCGSTRLLLCGYGLHMT